MLAHVAELAAATALPLSADLENCFADDPEAVARTITDAIGGGVAAVSVEDFSGDEGDPIYDIGLAAGGWRRPPRRPTTGRPGSS